jgi:hypothetical protein
MPGFPATQIAEILLDRLPPLPLPPSPDPQAVYDDIQKLINQVKTAESVDQAWAAFTSFVHAMTPLEKYFISSQQLV